MALLLAALGCSGSGVSSPAPPSPDGSWVLTTVNGKPLPVALNSGAAATNLVSETLIMRFDRTYARTSNTRLATSTGQPDAEIDMGDWDMTSGDLTIGAASAVLAGNVLTVRWSSAMTFSYSRQ